MNFFDLPKELPDINSPEIFEKILQEKNVVIERIISTGQQTPENEWYEQEKAEWVILLQGKAKLLFDDKSTVILNKGDNIYIPPMQKHRVTYTSQEPVCIWLAVHF